MKRFRIDNDRGYLKIVRYLEGLESEKTPLTCPHAKLLEEELKVIRGERFPDSDYKKNRIVCSEQAKRYGGVEGIRCQGLKNLSINDDDNLQGYCSVVGKIFDIIIKK